MARSEFHGKTNRKRVHWPFRRSSQAMKPRCRVSKCATRDETKLPSLNKNSHCLVYHFPLGVIFLAGSSQMLLLAEKQVIIAGVLFPSQLFPADSSRPDGQLSGWRYSHTGTKTLGGARMTLSTVQDPHYTCINILTYSRVNNKNTCSLQ